MNENQLYSTWVKKLSLLGFAVVALLFTACEADFPTQELDEHLKDPKPYAEIACTPDEDGTPRKACQNIGSNCKKSVSCADVKAMTKRAYKDYLKENFK